MRAPTRWRVVCLTLPPSTLPLLVPPPCARLWLLSPSLPVASSVGRRPALSLAPAISPSNVTSRRVERATGDKVTSLTGAGSDPIEARELEGGKGGRAVDREEGWAGRTRGEDEVESGANAHGDTTVAEQVQGTARDRTQHILITIRKTNRNLEGTVEGSSQTLSHRHHQQRSFRVQHIPRVATDDWTGAGRLRRSRLAPIGPVDGAIFERPVPPKGRGGSGGGG